MRKLLPSGSAHVRSRQTGEITAHVFVEDTDERNQIQRWLLLPEPTAFHAPPTHTIVYEVVHRGTWAVQSKQEWLELVRANWRPGSQFIKAFFRSHSFVEYPMLPTQPGLDPGFPRGTLAFPIDRVTAALACQFDFGLTNCQAPSVEADYVYRLPPKQANPTYEYCVLGDDAPDPAKPIEMVGPSDALAYATVEDFVHALMLKGIWGKSAHTFALGTCYLLDDVGVID